MATVQLDPESPERVLLTGSWHLAEDSKKEDVLRLNEKPETNILPISTTSSAINTGEPPKLNFQDHYSLGLTPPSTVIFRGRRIKVYESHDEQFLLEEIDASTLKLRRVSSASLGQTILRFSYTLIAIFLAGFLFVFCFQIALLIMMNLPVESGASELSDLDGSVLAGTFFAIPILLYGMASTMTLAVVFVTDTWKGGQLVRSLTGWPPYVREWVAFTVFLGVPAVVMVAMLFAERSNWWEITARVWVACVCLAFSVFCIGVIIREVSLCWLVVEEHADFLSPDLEVRPTINREEGGGEGDVASENDLLRSKLRKRWAILHRSFLVSQAHRYSGVVMNRYTVSGKDIASAAGATNEHYCVSENATQDRTKKSLYSRFVGMSLFERIFDKLDPPERLFTVDEIRDVESILTRQNWSLEKMCCRDSRRSTIMAARGPASLRYRQALSSFACSIVGSLLILLLLSGFLVWAELDVILVVLLTLFVFLCCLLPMVNDSFSLYRNYKGIYGITDGDDDTADVDNNIFQVWETKCLVRPRPRLCYATFVAELALFFLWPLGNLYNNNSVSMATCFLVVAFLSFFRIYCNVGAVLARTGMVSFRQRAGARDRTPEETLLAQARTSEIFGNITENRSVIRWMYVFGAVYFLLYIYYISAVGETSDVSPTDRPEIHLTTEYYYPKPKDENLAYPNCKLTNIFQEDNELGAEFVQLLDFAFLSALAYEDQENAQPLLDIWFGEGYLIDESEFVSEYRMQKGSHLIPVWYKLFRLNTTTTDQTAGIVAVRGTESKIDWLVNMQLWLSSGMAEIVKNIVPFGFVFEPIIDDMVTVVNVIQSESLKKVSYYSEVARFCRDILDQGFYDQLRLTGASLGGGTAMIAGAQTKVLTVAISGPNAVLARRTFDPPLSLDVLNNYVFNVIPDRDPIAIIGGRARLFQEIACSAKYNDFFGCHSMWRTVCETAFTCGAENRPALCMCVERFGYPLPQSRGTSNETFEELCGI